MSKIKELLEFNKEIFFDGAIQAEWFYNSEKINNVANSYIFHGPKYFGVSEKDINSKDHKLIDTASFVNKIGEKIAYDLDSSRYILTIAGYGAGKSHLAVTMGALFSGHNKKLQEDILTKIGNVEPDIVTNIKGTLLRPNLVIVLNGMKDFNLNYEVLKCTREALKLHNIDSDFLNDMTTAYNTAVVFIENTYELFKNKFVEIAESKAKYSMLDENELKNILIKNIEIDPQAFEIVNDVYKLMNGDYIRWDGGLTAGDILLNTSKILCEEKQIFNKILILFDEFGRYIEYTSAHPQQAGESALQQIFEAVQNANKNILFVGFIQSDLNSYLARVENANIVRYVGRYESSDKFYLSSNLETILANLFIKKDCELHGTIVNESILVNHKSYNDRLHKQIQIWSKSTKDKSVWSSRDLFNQVILKGAFPIHPLTVLILSNLSTWMQQRSTLTFVEEIFNEIKEQDINYENINYIYPIKLIDSKLFNELLNAEEKGLQQSQNCILYNSLMSKYEEKFDDIKTKVIQGILISNISKFTPLGRIDMISLLMYCTGIEEEVIKDVIIDLEDNFGVIRYDESIRRFEILAEGSGRNEFNRAFFINKIRVPRTNPIIFMDAELRVQMDLHTDENTSFALDNYISSFEWKFSKRIENSKEIDVDYIAGLDYFLKDAIALEGNRGIIIFTYVDSKSYEEVDRINNLIKTMELNKKPIIFILINDSQDRIKEGLIEYRALKHFTNDQNEQYKKFIIESKKNIKTKVVSTFLSLAKNRYILNGTEIEASSERLSILGSKTFKNIYSKRTSFNFDGFEKSVGANVKRYFGTICRGLITNSITNKQGMQGLGIDVLNRLQSSLGIENEHSWRVLSETGTLIEPQEGLIKEIFDEVNRNLVINEAVDIRSIFFKYLKEPYVMNQYSLGLFIAYFIGLNSNQLNIYDMDVKIKKTDFANQIYSDKKFEFNKLVKLKIQKIQGDQGEELKRSINKISNIIYVEDCIDALEKLKIIDTEELDNTTIENIELLKKKMNRGIELRNVIYNELDKYKSFYEKYMINSFNLKVIGNLKLIFTKSYERKIESSEFEYSNAYKEKIKDLLAKILDSIDKNIENYLKNQYKFVYEDIKTEESNINSIADILYNSGKDVASNLLKEVFLKKKTNLIEQQKYITIFNEFDNFVKMNNIINTKNYRDLESIKEEVLKWNSSINEINISPEKRKELTQKLVFVTEKINTRKNELNSLKELILNQINKIEESIEINQIETKINTFLGYIPEQEIEIKLRGILDLINLYKIDMKQLEIINFDRTKIEEISYKLENQYEDTFLYKLVAINIKGIKEKIDEIDLEWMNKNILGIKNKIFDLSVEECDEWKRNVINIPTYLSKQSLQGIKEISLLVNEQIKRSKVEGILSIFKDLELEEKEKCLKLLHGLL